MPPIKPVRGQSSAPNFTGEPRHLTRYFQDLEAIFAGLIPDASWNHAFGVMPQPDFPQSTHTQGATTTGGSHQQYDASYNYGSSAEEPHMPEWS